MNEAAKKTQDLLTRAVTGQRVTIDELLACALEVSEACHVGCMIATGFDKAPAPPGLKRLDVILAVRNQSLAAHLLLEIARALEAKEPVPEMARQMISLMAA